MAVAALPAALLSLPVTAADAAGCDQLTAGDLDFSAGLVNGSAGAASRCWSLPVSSGDTLVVSWAADTSGAIYRGQTKVCDLVGDRHPATEYRSAPCQLSGSGAFELRMTAADPTLNQFSYAFAIRRVNGAQGCGVLTPHDFGEAPGFSRTSSPGAPACALGDLPAGPLLVAAGSRESWLLFGPTGAIVCRSDQGGWCGVPVAANYTVVAVNDCCSTGTLALPVVPLRAATCSLDFDPGWDAAPTTNPARDPDQPRCGRLIGASAGQRVLPRAAPSEVSMLLLDSEGQIACTPSVDELGCEVTGSAPFRAVLLAGMADSGGVTAEVRRVDDPAGCTSLTRADFGVDNAAPAAECFLLTSDRSALHRFAGDSELDVYDATSFASVCTTAGSCALTSGTPYLVLHGYPGGRGSVQAYDAAASDGCSAPQPWLAGGIAGEAAWDGYDCLDLDLPAGSTVAPVRRLQASGTTVVTILDGSGEVVCERTSAQTTPCDLTGAGPYRALVRGSGAYGLAMARLDQPQGCQPMEVTPYGVADAARVSLADGEFVACWSVSAADLGAAGVVSYDRRAGLGEATLLVTDQFPAYPPCRLNRGERGRIVCHETQPAGETLSVLLASDGQASTWGAVAHSVSEARGCVDVPTLTLPGTVQHGRVDDFLEQDCYRFEAADGFVAGRSRGSSGGAVRASYYRPDGSQVCVDDAVAVCPVRMSGPVMAVVSDRGFGAVPGAYDLSLARVHNGSRAAPACADLGPYQAGFDEVSGVLDDDHPFACIAVALGARGELNVHVDSAGGGPRPIPDVVSVPSVRPKCKYQSETDYVCGWFMGTDADNDLSSAGALLLTRPAGADRVDYTVSATCAYDCATPPLSPWAARPSLTSSRVDEPAAPTSVGWLAPPTTVDYQWLLDGVEIPGATGTSYQPVAGDLGHQLSVRMTGVRELYGSATIESWPSAVVSGGAPASTRQPAISGGHRPGAKVTAGLGRWDKKPSGYRFIWRLDGKRLGTTRRSFVLKRAMVGKKLRVTVVATRPGCADGRAVSKPFKVRR